MTFRRGCRVGRPMLARKSHAESDEVARVWLRPHTRRQRHATACTTAPRLVQPATLYLLSQIRLSNNNINFTIQAMRVSDSIDIVLELREGTRRLKLNHVCMYQENVSCYRKYKFLK